jgi:hypothetical protein
MAKHLGVSESQLVDALPEDKQSWSSFENAPSEYSGFEGFFPDKAGANRFLETFE